MKRILAILLVLATLISSVLLFCACNTTNDDKTHDGVQNSNGENEQDDKTETQKPDDKAYVQSAYESLNKAFSITSSAIDDIYKSWYFTVYTANKFDSSGWGGFELQGINTAYAEAIGREYGTVSQACADIFNLDWTNRSKFNAVIKDVSYSVALIRKILKSEGIYSSIETAMESAKETLKNINKDSECYEDLLAYYTEMLSFQEFAESPSGSFSSLQSTINSYEKTIQGYKNRLSIYIE